MKEVLQEKKNKWSSSLQMKSLDVPLLLQTWFADEEIVQLGDGSIDSPDYINDWGELRKRFMTRFAILKACFKDPTEITKIVRKANETLLAFKERWREESSYILDVPEVMQISSFMSVHRCSELAKRFSNKVP
ncbi:hypothetical protein Tco_0667338 [Tanacetum coccineum]